MTLLGYLHENQNDMYALIQVLSSEWGRLWWKRKKKQQTYRSVYTFETDITTKKKRRKKTEACKANK